MCLDMLFMDTAFNFTRFLSDSAQRDKTGDCPSVQTLWSCTGSDVNNSCRQEGDDGRPH